MVLLFFQLELKLAAHAGRAKTKMYIVINF